MRRAGRMPAYVDTGLNVVHVDDVAEGHCWRWSAAWSGEGYILGGENLMLRDLLALVARSRRPPAADHRGCRSALVWPIALGDGGAWRDSTGIQPLVTRDHLGWRARRCSSRRRRRQARWATRRARPPTRSPTRSPGSARTGKLRG